MSCEQPAVIPTRFINQTSLPDKPYLDERPGLKIERLNETYSYAFNYAHPNGIILLTDRAKEFLQKYLSHSDVDTNTNLNEAAKTKMLRFLNPTFKIRPQTRTYWIHVTDSCNLGCFYCYISEIDRHRSFAREVLSSETAQLILSRVLEEARINGIRRIHFKFAGGEPTLALNAIETFCEQAKATFPSDVS